MNQVDLKQKIAWIHPDQAKARKAISVPLNADAMAVLIDAKGKHDSQYSKSSLHNDSSLA